MPITEPKPIPSLAEIDVKINQYETLHHTMLTPEQRTRARVEGQQEETERPKPRHPLGNHAAADQDGDHYTPENRAAVKASLYLYYDNGRSPNGPDRSTPLLLQEDDVGGALADQLNARRDAAVGLELNDRLVSRLELGCALRGQLLTYPEQARLLDRRYRQLWSIARCCEAGHYAERTFHNRLTDAVDALITKIYATAWTEAKSLDMAGEGLV